MTGWSNGNSFSGSSNFDASAGSGVGSGALRWPVPTWKFGLRVSDDRGGM